MIKNIHLPLTPEKADDLKCGDSVLLSGVIYTARDAAHQKLYDLILADKPLPIDLKEAIIYYVGPSPARPGQIIGAAGPTTSGRMDKFSPLLMEHGLKGMIGKGLRSTDVIAAIKQYKAIYFAALGGGGAILNQAIIAAEVAAYPELGAEAIYRLTVKDMPLTVVIDSLGHNLYNEAISEYQEFANQNIDN